MYRALIDIDASKIQRVPETLGRESQSTNIHAFLRSKYKDSVPSQRSTAHPIRLTSHITSSLMSQHHTLKTCVDGRHFGDCSDGYLMKMCLLIMRHIFLFLDKVCIVHDTLEMEMHGWNFSQFLI